MKRALYLVAILIILLLLTGCNGLIKGQVEQNDTVSSATEKRYQEVEIREYKGIKLDPSVGPRDNSISGIQTVDIKTYALEVFGLVDQSITLTYDQVLALNPYEKLITLHCVEGWDATVLWKGVLLKDIMDLAKVKDTANTVIFHCVDGYTTSLPLNYIIQSQIILANSSNGIELPSALGYPFIVVAEDKLGYKWARWVNKIELTDDPAYTGYWESRGYGNEADVPANRK